MHSSSAYTQYELEMLAPLGGPSFVERVVKAIRAADAAALNGSSALFDDVESCDVVGDIRRAKINEAIGGVATAMGLSCRFEKPEKQRYHTPVITADGTVLTVARMYGCNRVSRSSGLRCDLAQMRFELFDGMDDLTSIPDDNIRVLILAYEVGMIGSTPIVTDIELQEIGISPDQVTYRMNLVAKVESRTDADYEVMYDDFDIRPKEGLLRKHA